jgi:hypothetical protein
VISSADLKEIIKRLIGDNFLSADHQQQLIDNVLYTHTHAHTHTQAHTQAHTHRHTPTHTQAYTHKHAHTQARTHHILYNTIQYNTIIFICLLKEEIHDMHPSQAKDN